jgi:hypothetical protein
VTTGTHNSISTTNPVLGFFSFRLILARRAPGSEPALVATLSRYTQSARPKGALLVELLDRLLMCVSPQDAESRVVCNKVRHKSSRSSMQSRAPVRAERCTRSCGTVHPLAVLNACQPCTMAPDAKWLGPGAIVEEWPRPVLALRVELRERTCKQAERPSLLAFADAPVVVARRLAPHLGDELDLVLDYLVPVRARRRLRACGQRRWRA